MPLADPREDLMSFGGSIFLIAVGLVLALAVNISVSGVDLQLDLLHAEMIERVAHGEAARFAAIAMTPSIRRTDPDAP